MLKLKNRLMGIVLTCILIMTALLLASVTSFADGVAPFTSSVGTVDESIGTLSYSVLGDWQQDENGDWNPTSETNYNINLYTIHSGDVEEVTITFNGGNYIAYGYADAKNTYVSSCGNSADGSYANDSPGEATAIVRKVGGVFPEYVFVQTPYVNGVSEDLFAIHIAPSVAEDPVVVDEPAHSNTSEVVASYMSDKVGDEWYAMSLARDGKAVSEDYYQAVADEVKSKDGKIAKITDAAKYVLALTAGGYDATKVSGFDLVDGIAKSCIKALEEGELDIYSAIYSLIALDSHGYLDTEEGNRLRSELIKFALKGTLWDVDTKGMLVQALAPYVDDEKVLDDATKQEVIDMVSKLDASFDEELSNIDNSNTLAQVILAKSALGKDAKVAIDKLETYALENGSYCWKPSKNGAKSEDRMATYQVYQALVAASRVSNGGKSFYDMSDVSTLKSIEASGKKGEEPQTEEPKDEPAVKLVERNNKDAKGAKPAKAVATSQSRKAAKAVLAENATENAVDNEANEIASAPSNASNGEITNRTMMFIASGVVFFILALLALYKLIKESTK